MTEPEVPEELQDPFRTASPSIYAVPLTTLLAGAHFGLTEQVQLQPVSHPDPGVSAAPVVGGDDGD